MKLIVTCKTYIHTPVSISVCTNLTSIISMYNMYIYATLSHLYVYAVCLHIHNYSCICMLSNVVCIDVDVYYTKIIGINMYICIYAMYSIYSICNYISTYLIHTIYRMKVLCLYVYCILYITGTCILHITYFSLYITKMYTYHISLHYINKYLLIIMCIYHIPYTFTILLLTTSYTCIM